MVGSGSGKFDREKGPDPTGSGSATLRVRSGGQLQHNSCRQGEVRWSGAAQQLYTG